MGTRADFYVGRGKDAQWLGSIAMDGYPNGIAHERYQSGVRLLAATTEHQYRERLAEFFNAKGDQVTLPEHGWPWPWDDSHTTDYAYAFDGDRVWVSHFGYGWRDAVSVDDETEWDETKAAVFPNMSERKNVTLGPRSGVIVGIGPK